MKKLFNSKLNEKRNTLKDNFSEIKVGEVFLYEDWNKPLIKVSEEYAITQNAINKWIIFKSFINCLSIGSGNVKEFSTKEDAVEAISHKHLNID